MVQKKAPASKKGDENQTATPEAPPPAVSWDTAPVVGRQGKHFRDVDPNQRTQTRITVPAYETLEMLTLEGIALDTALRAIGFEDGEQDEAWQAFVGMFGPQVRHLKRLAAWSEIEDARRIRAGGKGWQGAMTWRERTQTERYGQRSKTGTPAGKKRSAIAELIGESGNRGTK